MDKARVLWDAAFMKDVATGWMITVLGALLLLLAACWWTAANSPTGEERAPSVAWRSLVTIGVGLFLFGWIWQLVGYGLIGVGRF